MQNKPRKEKRSGFCFGLNRQPSAGDSPYTKPPIEDNTEEKIVTTGVALRSHQSKHMSFRYTRENPVFSPKPKNFVKRSNSAAHFNARGKSYFGIDLLEADKDDNVNVPKIIVKCCELIEEKANDEDIIGLYRIPGEFVQIQKIGSKINRKDYSCLNDVKSIHTLASVVKIFLRESNTPLICSSEIQQFPGLTLTEWTLSLRMKRINSLKLFTKSLDETRRDTLKYIIEHLYRLCHQKAKQLNSQNLSITVGPALLRVSVESSGSILESLKEHEVLNEYMKFMIDHCIEIFK